MIAFWTVAAGLSVVGQGPPPVPVRVDAVRSEMVQERRTVTGEVRPRRRSFVASREGGLVLEMEVRPGDVVAEGGLLARLDGSRLELALATMGEERRAAEVLLEQRREESAQADRDREVARELATKKTVGQKQLVDATSAAKVARIRVAQAETELDVLRARQAELQRRLDDTRIVAPFGGVVVAKLGEVGEWLEVGRPLVELVSVDDLEVWLDVPQRFAEPLSRVQDPIEVLVEAVGLEVALGVGRAVPQVDPTARTFKYVLDLPRARQVATGASGPSAVAPGMSVVAQVPTGERREHWTVARDAILRGPTGSFLFVARGPAAEGPLAVERVAVDVLFTHRGRAVVGAEGLAAGDRAVVEGNERLFPGALVSPVSPEGAAGGEPDGAGADGAATGQAKGTGQR